MNLEPSSASSASVPSLSVLVVDDYEDNATLLAELLRSHGYSVRTANTGKDAIARAEEAAPDVVLLDLDLPDIEGPVVASRIRARFGNRVRLIALTGLVDKGSGILARAKGFDGFLVKPSSSEQVERTMRAVCGRIDPSNPTSER